MDTLLATQFISELFGIQDYYCASINSTSARIIIELEGVDDAATCPCCKTHGKRYDHTVQTIFIGTGVDKPVYAKIKVWRVKCERCSSLRTEQVSFIKGKERYSKAVSQLVVTYSKEMDNAAVSRLLGISESTVYRIDKAELQKMEERYKENISAAAKLCVDEVSIKKGHTYATVISDYDTGNVLWLEKGRDCTNLENGFTVLKATNATTNCVAMDMWKPYEKATRRSLPCATIFYDLFHIARILNRAVESERRDYQSELEQDQRLEIKKQTRWVLLKRSYKMSMHELYHLIEMKRNNERLYELYLLKEDFMHIFQKDTLPEKAKDQIFRWIYLINKTDFSYLKSFAKTIWNRLNTVLNWFTDTVSNGMAEGINNVIKTLLKRGYGYKDFTYFRLKVLQKCGMLMNYTTHSF